MNEDALQQLKTEMELLQGELLATQTRLRQLYQRVHELQAEQQPGIKSNFLKTPYPPRPSLENFIGLRLIHLVGIVVFVIGLSLGVKYAIDEQLISEGARIALAYAAGGLLFVLSCG